jgi:hypothetical protein
MAGEFTHERPQRHPVQHPGAEVPVPQTTAAPTAPTGNAALEERLERLRKERAIRDGQQEEIEKAREADVLELEGRLAEQYGVRGEEFDIVDGGKDGPIGLALIEGIGVLYKGYRAKVRKDADKQEDLVAFVRPCIVHPSKERFDEIVRKRGFILDRCGSTLLALCGGWEDRTKGKS